MKHTLVQYQGGGYDGCIWEWNFAFYDNSGNSWSESSDIDAVLENISFFNFDCMDRHSDGHAILILLNEHQSSTADLAVWDITNISTQTSKAYVRKNISSRTQC